MVSRENKKRKREIKVNYLRAVKKDRWSSRSAGRQGSHTRFRKEALEGEEGRGGGEQSNAFLIFDVPDQRDAKTRASALNIVDLETIPYDGRGKRQTFLFSFGFAPGKTGLSIKPVAVSRKVRT